MNLLNDFHNLYLSSNKIKGDGIGGVIWCSSRGEDKKCIQILVGSNESKKSPARRRSRRQNNIKMDLKETGCEVVEGIHLVRERGHAR